MAKDSETKKRNVPPYGRVVKVRIKGNPEIFEGYRERGLVPYMWTWNIAGVEVAKDKVEMV